jgi:sugar phosphate isomerase/epimerase
VAVNPAYDDLFAGFGPAELKSDPVGRQAWASEQVIMGAKARRNLGIDAQVTFSGGLMWHTVYPWPQRPAGLVEEAFKELSKRWMPILNVHEEVGVDVCYEIHPGEDIHDGITFEMFREATGNHSRVCINYDPSHFLLQQLDYLHFIDLYHPFIKAFHVKDAEFNSNGRVGVYGGYQSWKDRAGRFRSLGDGQIDFKGIFSKLTQYGYDSWAVLEWECCIKDGGQGAREGSAFIRDHMIDGVKRAFDDFAAGDIDQDLISKIIGNV